MQDTTNILANAKAMALKEWLEYCLENRFSSVILESESLSLINMLKGNWIALLSVTLEVNSINRMRVLLTTRIQHTSKKGKYSCELFH